MSISPLSKIESGHVVNGARIAQGVSWADLATAINRPLVWTVAALLGKHPLNADDATTICDKLGLSADIAAALQLQPYRIADPELATDPTIYRLHEAVNVYGPALKELIHEEFGDGIMSAINFSVSFGRRAHPDGDRVVITLDGKFLPYQWT